jgi:RNA polymerase sigma-70 factor (ECF subfamily)
MTMNTKGPHRYDEAQWIEKAVNGDLDAFNQLVLSYQPIAYSHAYGLLGDPASAEDATQEAFLHAFQAMRGFRGGSFRAWLLKIVTNAAYDMLRRSGRHPTQPLFPVDEDGEEVESPAWLADPNPSVQETVEGNEFTKKIYKLLDELPEVYRSVLTLVDVLELDYAEAAQTLNVPLGTIKSRLARARFQMQKKLRESASQERHISSAQTCLAV